MEKALRRAKNGKKLASTRGGARPNSGPKAGPDGAVVAVTFGLTTRIVTEIDRRAKDRGVSRSVIGRELLDVALAGVDAHDDR